MTDPVRWSDPDGGASFQESELLRVGAEESMPSAVRERAWAGIALAVGAGVAGASGIAGATAASSSLATATGAANSAGPTVAAKGFVLLSGPFAKGVVVVALLGGAGVFGLTRGSSLGSAQLAAGSTALPATLASAGVDSKSDSKSERFGPAQDIPRASSPTLSAPSELSQPTTERSSELAASGAGSASDGKPRVTGTSRPSPLRLDEGEARAPESAQRAPAASRLREESLAVLAVRHALLSGNAGQALRLLEQARTQFAGGALAEEREALGVRALLDSGQKGAARQRAKAFLRAFPRSPHASEVRRLLDG